jgi:ATP-dependent DNA helicase 2 subunit 1
LVDANVDIDLFPMSKPESQRAAFDVKIFFADILSLDEEEISDMTDLDNSHLKVLELSKWIRQKEFKKRTLGKCTFSLSPNMNIGFSFFNLVKSVTKPSAKFVNAANNKQLETTTKHICKATGTELYEDQIGCHYDLKGEQKVNITWDDVKKIKQFDLPGMKLMGFKKKESLKCYHNIRPSYFIYPDEKRVKGSGQVSDSLIKSLIKKDKIAMIRFVPREGANVRFAALIPQAEKVDEEDGYVTPPGFHVLILPFAEDVREVEEDPLVKKILRKTDVNETELKTAKLFIKNMSIDFDSNNFENPSIQKFYAGLQAFALNENEPEPVEDTLEPDYEGMAKMEKVVERAKHTFFGGAKEDFIAT